MYKSIFLGLFVIFFVIGVVTVISYILIRAVAPDKNSRFFIVSVFDRNSRECSVKISCVLSIITVLGLYRRCRIIAVDNGMSDCEKKNLLWAFQRENNVTVCSKDMFFSHIENFSVQSPENGSP